MAVEGQCESYHDYTRDSVEWVNHGGDTAYSFFVCLEMKTRQCLSRHFSSQPPSKQSVMDSIVKDEDVLFSWTMAAETESPAISIELLWHVVELWLTI